MSTHRGSRAFGLGSRGPLRPAIISLALAAIAVAGLVLGGVLWAQARPAPATSSPATYGGIPSWIPTPKASVGRVVVASPAHPWLAIEGDTVFVALADGQVMATAVGPAVPEEGQFPVPPTSPCTFTVTLAHASGTIPLSSGAFTILDELGQLHHPRVTALNGGPLPAAVAPGQTVTLTVRDILPTGNGQVRWAPGTAKPVVSWDFDVEID